MGRQGALRKCYAASLSGRVVGNARGFTAHVEAFRLLKDSHHVPTHVTRGRARLPGLMVRRRRTSPSWVARNLITYWKLCSYLWFKGEEFRIAKFPDSRENISEFFSVHYSSMLQSNFSL